MRDKELENKNKWEKLLKDRKAFCYIKPNRYIHESGFRCFEVGYCTVKDGKVDEKLILSKRSDHFWHHKDFLNGSAPLEFSMDILRDGYMRIFDRKILTWENSYTWLVSSFELEEIRNESY